MNLVSASQAPLQAADQCDNTVQARQSTSTTPSHALPEMFRSLPFVARADQSYAGSTLRVTPMTDSGFKADIASPRTLRNLVYDGSKIVGCFNQYDPVDYTSDHVKTDF